MNTFFEGLLQHLSRNFKPEMQEMQEQRLTSEETADILRQALSIRAALAVGVVPLPTDPPDELLVQPLVWLEASTRPDVKDLGRVHQIEGEGDMQLTWMGLDLDRASSHFLLQCTFIRPVRTTFLVDFPVPPFLSLLELIGETARLTLLTGELPAWAEQDHERQLSQRDLEALEQTPDHFSFTFDEIALQGLFNLLKRWCEMQKSQ